MAALRPVLLGLTLAALSLVAWESLRPALLIVGNATIDLVDGKKSLGGAISYAAAVAEAYGVRACIVTAAGSDADLAMFKGHDLHVVPTESTLTFEHTYTWWGHKRKLRVTAAPNVTLTMDHVPRHCRGARTILLGPLTPQDLNAATFVPPVPSWWQKLLGARQHVGYMAQGEQRTLDSTGRVIPAKLPSQHIQDAVTPQTSIFLSDVETDVWPKGSVAKLAAQSNRFVVTRGELGADVFSSDSTIFHFDAEKVNATDTNGAGDTFATAYMLALSRGSSTPGAVANWAASRAVMLPQSCKPGCITSAIRDATLWSQFRAASSLRWQWSSNKVAVVIHGIADRLEAITGPAGIMLQHCQGHANAAVARVRRQLGI
ncbi:hypothetical protein WJX74_002373 [Apatococcus lobatus]|uniref:Carbohydrate kinase PfkB domain-containing protein n=1 Tax=Apatococcus lobatus TaxID=904363 RepID=A0AAW1RQT4_9CHLO